MKYLAVDPVGDLLLSVGKKAALWDLSTGKVDWILPRDADYVCYSVGFTAASFSDDGRMIATGSGDKVAIWLLDERRLLHVFRVDADIVTDLEFLPTGEAILAAALFEYPGRSFKTDPSRRSILFDIPSEDTKEREDSLREGLGEPGKPVGHGPSADGPAASERSSPSTPPEGSFAHPRPTHELTAIDGTGLGYNPKDNLTRDQFGKQCAWDFDNMLQSATVPASAAGAGQGIEGTHTYEYDALGRRVAKVVNDSSAGTSTRTVFVCLTQPIPYSPYAGQVLAEYEGSGPLGQPPTGADLPLARKYAYGTYIDEPLLLLSALGSGLSAFYYHQNRLYNVTALTDSTAMVTERYAYTPYGELTFLDASADSLPNQRSTVGNSYTFAGGRWDAESGQDYYRARYFQPVLGRFGSRDDTDRQHRPWVRTNRAAMGFAERRPADEERNLYGYVEHAPLKYRDPSGLGIDWACFAKCLVTQRFGPGGPPVAAQCFRLAQMCRTLPTPKNPTCIAAAVCFGAWAVVCTLECWEEEPKRDRCQFVRITEPCTLTRTEVRIPPTVICHYGCGRCGQTVRRGFLRRFPGLPWCPRNVTLTCRICNRHRHR
ncbi:MAG: hypothetical protein GXP27_05275 [Planctomycetes bacterium]|nr:hypothetical protein [Planctomycetota bacterium]